MPPIYKTLLWSLLISLNLEIIKIQSLVFFSLYLHSLCWIFWYFKDLEYILSKWYLEPNYINIRQKQNILMNLLSLSCIYFLILYRNIWKLIININNVNKVCWDFYIVYYVCTCIYKYDFSVYKESLNFWLLSVIVIMLLRT